MRIAVFGANGPTGRHLTDQAPGPVRRIFAGPRRLARTLAARPNHPSTSSTRQIRAHAESTHQTPRAAPRRSAGQALAAGHEVVAVTRRPGSLPARPGLTAAVADATDPRAVDTAVEGTDAVLSALGARFSKQPITLYSRSATAITEAMAHHGVRRLLVISSSIADPGWRPTGAHFFNHVLDPLVNRRLGRTLHADMGRMEGIVRRTALDWTLVRPSGLFEHPAVTDYRTAPSSADGVFTARSDLAASMLRELEERRHVRTAMGVITTAVKPNIAKLIWNEGVKKK